MFNRSFALIVCVITVAGIVLAVSSEARSPIVESNRLTFDRTVALPGVVLAPGTYTFEREPAGTHPDVVRVTTRNGQRVLFQGFTQRVLRPSGAPQEEIVSFGETTPGRPAPIVVWYPMSASAGHKFLYQ